MEECREAETGYSGPRLSLVEMLEADLLRLLAEATSAQVHSVLANDSSSVAANPAPPESLATGLRVTVPEVVCHASGLLWPQIPAAPRLLTQRKRRLRR